MNGEYCEITIYDDESNPKGKFDGYVKNIFGDVLNISCCGEEKIVFKSDGTSGNMNVEISTDDLTEFAISDEGKDLSICFGLNYLHKMCINTKLANDINVSLSNDTPMRIKYDLGKDSHCVFYLAPKSDD
jgi:DNA polymerase III sliding clamp (beta) subunit (PCNA family)